MDVKINAQGRYVEVTGLPDTDFPQVMAEVFALWKETEPETITPEIGAGASVSTERSYSRMGFAFMGDGERPHVQ